MDSKTRSWADFLRQTDFSGNFSKEEIYRAACVGAVMLLYESGDCAGLTDAVRHAAAPESRSRALHSLEALTRNKTAGSQAVHCLHELAVLDGISAAADFLRKTGLQDSDPAWNCARMLLFEQKHQLQKEEQSLEQLTDLFLNGSSALRHRLMELGKKVIPNWTLLIRFMAQPVRENRDALLKGFSSFTQNEQKLLRYCAISTEAAVKSLSADLLLRYDDAILSELCVKYDLHPSDASQEALFYFLSGQWNRYYASDSDYRCIRIAWEQKDPKLQRRLIAVGRDSGNTAWLRDLDGNTESPHSGTLSDQRLLAASLTEQRQWDRLWQLLPSLPLLCMPQVLRSLKDAGFVPCQADEKAFFSELSEKINACGDLSPIPVMHKLCENAGTAVGVCGGGNWLGVLFSDRRILLWDRRSISQEPIRIFSNHLNFRSAIISNDGKYLIADCGQDGAPVFTLPGGQVVKTIAFPGTILAGIYLQEDNRRFITLTRNGVGKIFSFPGCAELHHFEIGLKDCSRTSYDPKSNLLLAVDSKGESILYDINSHRPINGLDMSPDITAASASFSRGRVPISERDGSFSLINLLSGKPLYEKLLLTGTGICRITDISNSELFALGTLDGHIRIFEPAAGTDAAVLSFGSKNAVTGLLYDADESLLFGCNAVGTVRAWDLKLFHDMIRTLPLLDLPGIGTIDNFVKKYPESGVKAAADWLKTVIAWRRRFDIELDFE